MALNKSKMQFLIYYIGCLETRIGETKKTTELFLSSKFSLLVKHTLRLSSLVITSHQVFRCCLPLEFLFVYSYFSKLYVQAVQRAKEERDMAIKQNQLLQQELVSIWSHICLLVSFLL